MAQSGTDRFGGEYMVQDRNHMSEISPATDKAHRGGVRQAEQSQTESRQQGGEHGAGSRRSEERQRQHH